MNVNTERRTGLGRGLGELFQRTEPAPSPPAPVQTGAPVTSDATDTGRTESPGPAVNEAARGDQAAGGAEPGRMPDGSSFAEIPVTAISPNPRQPRTVFDEDALAELVESIREVGLLQPVVVRPLGDDRYELVMGERRWRATQAAGLDAIPAIIRETETHDLLRDALLENLHRAQLNPLEEAAAYQQMLEDFACTQDELAARIKRSRPQISNTIRLLRLPPTVQRRVAAGVLSAGHARALLGIDQPLAQERLAQRIVAEGLSVRATEEIVSLGSDEGDKPTRRATTRPALSEQAESVRSHLADRLDTQVTIEERRGRGRIVIDFSGPDDLGRLKDLLT